ncbi:MAG: dicarboxylate/amino acid:cation symporter [Gammaproteobacteria bacterium]|nr:dicarboxylate/amino acid:cation symporter [Gammaproteobacteria bacterium]
MCQPSDQKKIFSLSTPVIYLIMIILGVFAGLSDIPLFKSLGLLVADVFIRIFRCISLPIIVLSIIVTLSNYCSQGIMKTVWRRTMCYTLGTTMLAAGVSFMLYLIISPATMVVNDAIVAPAGAQKMTYVDHIASLIPMTIFSPFLENQVISVLVLGIVFGIAIRFIPDEDAKQTITHFFKGAHGLFMVITRWVITVIPIGLFGFITTTVVQFRQGADLKGLGQYLLVVVLANVVQGFVILPLWLKWKGVAPFEMMRRMLPALSLAFFSKSSVGALPVTMDTAETKLNVRPEISRFVLPLCTSINMNGCAAFIFTTVIYLMQNHGIHMSITTMALWVIIATVAAIGNAGVPMGCFFLSMSLLASMSVPITLMGIILPFYSVIDMIETALNVWSDSCVVKVVDDSITAGQVTGNLDDVAVPE